MSKSPLREIFDYKKDNRRRPKELAEWLDVPANKAKLKDMKILYVIKPNKDELLKFGIAGARDGGTSAEGRLRQYVNIYGKQTDDLPCLGVKLYYIFGKINIIQQCRQQTLMYLKKKMFLLNTLNR
jgi:hypothetical protein